MSKRLRAFGAGMVAAVAMLVAASPASAADFVPTPGTYTVDTTALTLTGPGTNIPGSDQGGVAVFGFDNVSIPSGVLLEVEGSRPFKLVAGGELAIAGTIEASGFSAEEFQSGPYAGGPGGGPGGVDGADPGGGPGGGGVSLIQENGGGGGGFGGAGARGGVDDGVLDPPGLGGAAYGDLNSLLQGGSGGGGGSTVGGGGGGGAVALFGSIVRILPGAEVFADGGSGALGGHGASGGGSGGGILIYGDNVVMDGLLGAAGGDGGTGGCCGDGGGGGGGRIALQYRTLSMSGVADVSGGVSGGGGSGEPSTEPTGAPGVITKTETPTGVTAPIIGVTVKPPACIVPKLKGKKAPAARKALKRANCKVGKVRRSFSGKVKKGRVIKQGVKPGKVLSEGARVGIKVSKGEKNN